VELNTGRLHVRKAKNGSPSVHPIRALRRLQREQGPSSPPEVLESVRCPIFTRLIMRPITRRGLPRAPSTGCLPRGTHGVLNDLVAEIRLQAARIVPGVG
jgi:hypothetical protein